MLVTSFVGLEAGLISLWRLVGRRMHDFARADELKLMRRDSVRCAQPQQARSKRYPARGELSNFPRYLHGGESSNLSK